MEQTFRSRPFKLRLHQCCLWHFQRSHIYRRFLLWDWMGCRIPSTTTTIKRLQCFPILRVHHYGSLKPVNRDTGQLYGEAVGTRSLLTVNTSMVQKALNIGSASAYSSLGLGWNKA